ncbi:inosine-5'-monophosphate dehydrogenase [Streptomyces lydicamycinicus]|uniref:Inosine-5'-monophosphate dehydrogenase n=1 Tax=Streptomyces lydicamycinicus TaxID=1546107 RepID=A0A0P4RCL8_9ACTN|nr:inosine-5'-monophosphate dehydrogenase [Streptomyces lydicamycinicus]
MRIGAGLLDMGSPAVGNGDGAGRETCSRVAVGVGGRQVSLRFAFDRSTGHRVAMWRLRSGASRSARPGERRTITDRQWVYRVPGSFSYRSRAPPKLWNETFRLVTPLWSGLPATARRAAWPV